MDNSIPKSDVERFLHDLSNKLVPICTMASCVEAPCPDHLIIVQSAQAAQRLVQAFRKEINGIESTGVCITVKQFTRMIQKMAGKDFEEVRPWTVHWHDHLYDEDQSRLVYSFPREDRIIQDNLVSNWQKAGVTEIHVSYWADRRTDAIVFELSDNGCGISQDQLEKIRTGPLLGEGSCGEGCQILRRLCAETGRTISWESIEYVGTKITIRVFPVET